MDIFQLSPACHDFVLSRGSHNETLREAELQGKEAITKYYEDRVRSYLASECDYIYVPGTGTRYVELPLPELLAVRNESAVKRALRGEICDPLPEPISMHEWSLSRLVEKVRETKKYGTYPYEYIVRLFTPPVIYPELELVVCKGFVRKEEITYSEEVVQFLGKDVVDQCTKDEVTCKYVERAIIVCDNDLIKMGFVGGAGECVAHAEERREYGVGIVSLRRVGDHLSEKIKKEFCPGLYDEENSLEYCREQVVKAYDSIGIPEDVVDKMIVAARPVVTLIPKLEFTTRIVKVKKENGGDKFEQWMGKLDKEGIEKALERGFVPIRLTLSRDGALGTEVVEMKM